MLFKTNETGFRFTINATKSKENMRAILQDSSGKISEFEVKSGEVVNYCWFCKQPVLLMNVDSNAISSLFLTYDNQYRKAFDIKSGNELYIDSTNFKNVTIYCIDK